MALSVIEQIIGDIADVEDVEPIDLDVSLEDYVSTSAIDELVEHKSNAWRLQFETPHHVVEVTGNDDVLVDGERTRTLE